MFCLNSDSKVPAEGRDMTSLLVVPLTTEKILVFGSLVCLSPTVSTTEVLVEVPGVVVSVVWYGRGNEWTEGLFRSQAGTYRATN